MVDIAKIFRGMQNGAETIQANFNLLNDGMFKTSTVTITGIYNITLTLRRTGNDVELVTIRQIISSAEGHEQVDAEITIPSGYRPISRALAKFELNNGSTLYNPMILRLDNDGKTYLTNEAFTNNRYIQSYATWKTNDPWPTSN
ncbi:hypothetical protein [Lactococcus taiwanensis]|uniref:hypothetical protein n=1 Tax=Lactococcus taiwanensis TaxID=1151742 RepID=UPI002896F056|nr:hypothetical protein [Lactococcus taiwanensis]